MDLDSKIATEYSEETATQRDMAQFQEHFQWFQENWINYELPWIHLHTLRS